MKETEKNGFLLKTDLAELSKNMIAGLGENSMVQGDRCSLYFVLAASERDPEAEMVVSLIERKSNLSPKEYHYTVVLIDYTSGGSGEAVLYHTNELSEADLIRVLQEIWCDLGKEIDEVDEIDKEAEFAYLKSYIRGACFDDEISVDYLYSLWIAFCLHHGLTVDKDEYQERMEGLWKALEEIVEVSGPKACPGPEWELLWKALEESDGGEVSHWENYSSFDSDMSRKLQ